MSRLRVIGIDPGTLVAGWGVIEAGDGAPARRLGSGCWRFRARAPVVERLHALRCSLEEVLEQWQPGLLAVEAAFFGRNARSALRLGEARGVVLAGAAAAGLEVAELAPALVKRRVGGSGALSKQGMAALVAAQLGLEPEFSAPDESDALAVALCAVLERHLGQEVFRHNRGGLPPGAELQ